MLLHVRKTCLLVGAAIGLVTCLVGLSSPPAPLEFARKASPAPRLLDGNPLRTALYAAAPDGATVTWSPGIYFLGEDEDFGYAFVLNGDPIPATPRSSRTNLTIDATGVTIIITNPNIGVFNMKECHGLTIKGLTIDYDPLPWNQSTITGIDQDSETGVLTFDVALDPAYINFEHPAFDEGFLVGNIFDPVTRLVKNGTGLSHINIISAQNLGLGNYRLTLDSNSNNPSIDLSYFEVGDLYLQAVNGGTAMLIEACEATTANPHPVTIDGVTMYATSGKAIAINSCPAEDPGQARILNTHVTRPTPDDGRLATVVGGGFIISSCRTGPKINNCTMLYSLDDALNINCKARLFQSYFSTDFSSAEFGIGVVWQIGDQLQLLDPPTGQIVYRTITNTFPLPFGHILVTFDQPAPGMTSDGTVAGSTHAYNMNMACPDFNVRNSTWGRNNKHGALLFCPGKFINNVVESTTRFGIAAANIYLDNKTGPAPDGVIIRNNIIRNCGHAVPAPSNNDIDGSAISVGARKVVSGSSPRNTPADYQSASNIVVEGNTIENWITYGIHLAAASNCSIIDWNGASPHYQTFLGPTGVADRAIYIGNPTGSTVIDGVDALGSSGFFHMPYAITIEPGVDFDVLFTTNILVASPTLPVQDLR